MANIYIAFQPNGARLASGSQTTIKKKMGAFPNSEWTLMQYEIKADVDTLCGLIEFQIPGTIKMQGENYKVTENGTVKKK